MSLVQRHDTSYMYRVERKSLTVTIIDEFYTFDLMEIRIILFFFFFLHCVLLITKIKLFQGTNSSFEK